MGAFQKDDVPESLRLTLGNRVALKTGTPLGQHHEWEIRPRFLAPDPPGQNLDVGIVDDVVGHHRKPRSIGDLLYELSEVVAYLGDEFILVQDVGSNLRVAPLRRKDERAFRIGVK